MDLALVNVSGEARERLANRLGPARAQAILERNGVEYAADRAGKKFSTWFNRAFGMGVTAAAVGGAGALGIVSMSVAMPIAVGAVVGAAVSVGMFNIHALAANFLKSKASKMAPDQGQYANAEALAVLRERPSLSAAMRSTQPVEAQRPHEGPTVHRPKMGL